MAPRAPALPADERRRALVEATLPLLRERGRAVSTKEIAAAAGVAEGTIFRVFESKEQLFDAALRSAFEPAQIVRRLEAIDPGLPLQARLVAMAAVLQDRFIEVFTLMSAMGMTRPPDDTHDHHHGTPDSWRSQVVGSMERLIGPDADQLRVPPAEFLRYLRLLAFSGSHPHIADHRLLTPEEMVDVLLHGLGSGALEGKTA